MRKGRMITVTMIAVLLGSSAYIFRTRAKQDEAYANVTVVSEYPGDDRRVLISAPGITEPQSGTIEIVSEVTGVLLEVHVAAGDMVSKGQILAELANDIQSAHVDLAQATLEKAQAELARLKNGDRPEEQAVLEAQYQAALASNRLARFEWQQIEDMTERAVAARREVAEARAALELASAQSDAARKRWELSKIGARVEDISRAEAVVRGAEAQLATARSVFEKTFFHSPLDGMVISRYREPGEAVFAVVPQPILTIGNRSTLHIRVDVDEIDVARVWDGQRVFATARAFEGRRFEGRVIHVEPTLGRKNFRTNLPTEKIDTKVQEVVVALDGADEIPLGFQMVVWFMDRETQEKMDSVPEDNATEIEDDAQIASEHEEPPPAPTDNSENDVTISRQG